MKRFLTILLIPVFLLATVGFTVNYLYCQGKLTGIGIGIKACCKKGGCCEKESKLIKVKDNFVKLNNTINLSKTFVILHTVFEVSYTAELNKSSYINAYRDKAPPFRDVCRYILFHSLII
jgi:hypothetical protein